MTIRSDASSMLELSRRCPVMPVKEGSPQTRRRGGDASVLSYREMPGGSGVAKLQDSHGIKQMQIGMRSRGFGYPGRDECQSATCLIYLGRTCYFFQPALFTLVGIKLQTQDPENLEKSDTSLSQLRRRLRRNVFP